jgi:hypothetical protein
MYLGRDKMYTVRTTVDYQSDTTLETSDRDHAVMVGALLASTKAYAQVEVEDPTHTVIWATYPPSVTGREKWSPSVEPTLLAFEDRTNWRIDLVSGDEVPLPLPDHNPGV